MCIFKSFVSKIHLKIDEYAKILAQKYKKNGRIRTDHVIEKIEWTDNQNINLLFLPDEFFDCALNSFWWGYLTYE